MGKSLEWCPPICAELDTDVAAFDTRDLGEQALGPKGKGEMVAAAIGTIFAQPTARWSRAQVETIVAMLEPHCQR